MAYTFINYTVTKHRCTSCGTLVAAHSSLNSYIEPPIRPCPKCKKEVIVTTCNEWELLSEHEMVRYRRHLFQTLVQGAFPVFMVVVMTVGCLAFFGLQDFAQDSVVYNSLRARIPFAPFTPDIDFPFFFGISSGILTLVAWEFYWIANHFKTVRESRLRTADPAYRARVVQLLESLR